MGSGLGAQLSKPFNPASHGTVKLSGFYEGPDPDVVGAGLNAHRDMTKALAAAVRAQGLGALEPRPPAPNYDLRWDVGGTTWIAEIKSLTASNESHQLRLGLGQLLEFLYAHKTLDTTPTYAGVLVVTAVPGDVAFWRDVCANYGITLVAGTSDLALVGL